MNPKISVIIPAYNEEKVIGKCLEALKNQSYPQEKYEIIVVDNGSRDNTAEIAKSFGVRVYTYKEVQGCAAARKFGVEKAKGDIIAFTDSDAAVFPDWLEKIDELLEDTRTVFIGGPAYPLTKNRWNNFVFFVYHGFDLFHVSIRKPLMGGYNMAVKKRAHDEIGGIKSSLKSSDDWELSLSLAKHFGHKRIRYSRKVKAYVSTRKQDKPTIFMRYFKDQITNYYNLVLLGKSQTNNLVSIR